MTGYDGRPLLVLDRVGKGRVAQLLSDEMWLWTRGYEGGGPQAELLRRVVYWLMKEPDLEENDLRAEVDGNRLDRHPPIAASPTTARCRSPAPTARPQTLTWRRKPAGAAPRACRSAESGLYRVTDGKRTALAAAGALNPIEMCRRARHRREGRRPTSRPPAAASSGSAPAGMPDIRRVGPGRAAAGRGWLGLRANGDYVGDRRQRDAAFAGIVGAGFCARASDFGLETRRPVNRRPGRRSGRARPLRGGREATFRLISRPRRRIFTLCGATSFRPSTRMAGVSSPSSRRRRRSCSGSPDPWAGSAWRSPSGAPPSSAIRGA